MKANILTSTAPLRISLAYVYTRDFKMGSKMSGSIVEELMFQDLLVLIPGWMQ